MNNGIVFFMHRFAGGGAERVTILLANELVARGYDVSFWVRYDDGPFRGDVDDCVTVVPLSRYGQVESSVGLLKAMRNAIAELEPQVLFSISLGMSTFALLAKVCSFKHFRFIPVIHNTMSRTADRSLRIKLQLMRIFDRQVYRTVVVSESAKRDYLKVAKVSSDRVISIYNPVVSSQLFTMATEKPNHKWFDDSIPVIVAVGRLESQKNYPLMLQAMQMLNVKRPTRLVILGEGSQRELLQEQAERLGIADMVDFHGFEANPYSYFSHSACFVMSSDYEGLPTVMIEALACGCPVVSTDCPSGPREILDNGRYGRLIPVGDAEALAHAISETISGDHPDMGALKQRGSSFSVDIAVSRYMRLLED